jgi:hypothetical protein
MLRFVAVTIHYSELFTVNDIFLPGMLGQDLAGLVNAGTVGQAGQASGIGTRKKFSTILAPKQSALSKNAFLRNSAPHIRLHFGARNLLP